MVNGFGPMILFSIVIIAIIIGFISIAIMILNINENNESILDMECKRSCSTPGIPNIQKDKCLENLDGNCTSFVKVNFNLNDISDPSYLILSPVARSSTDACANFCVEPVFFDEKTKENVCPSCINNKDCEYNQCINTITGSVKCSRQIEPVACVGQKLYYLYSYVPIDDIDDITNECTCLKF